MPGRRLAVGALVACSLCAATSALATTDPTVPTVAAAPVGPPAGPPPKAYIVVDQATGRVVFGSNTHQPLPPASLTKVLTALTATAALKTTDVVPVSARAAGMPAHKLNMKVGEKWPLDQALNALLVSSANDAGAAIAERVSGTMENFKTALAQTSTALHLADHPLLQDPSGLDDNFSIGGGNLISARDLAIATRALLANPLLAGIVKQPVTRFTDVSGIPHRLLNHNKLLTRCFGAVGVKTGFTKKSGRGLIAAATRNGRTEIAVVLNVSDTYGWAEALLDQAFASPVPTSGDQLPPIGTLPHINATPSALAATASSVTAVPPTVVDNPSDVIAVKPAAAARSGLPLYFVLPLGAIFTLLVMLTVLRLRVSLRKSRRRRARANATIKRHPNRKRHPVLTTQYQPREHLSDRFHAATRD